MNTKANELNYLSPTIEGASLPHCGFGMLLPAESYVDCFGTPRSGRPRSPVLAAHCNLTRLRAVAGGQACFGFGRIGAPGTPVISIRSQIGSVQTYWLADASDAQVWSAIDSWRRNRYAPVAMFENDLSMYSAHPIDWIPGKSKSGIDDLRHACGNDRSASFLAFAAKLAASGRLEEQATTDIEGVALSHVEVNVLLTERLGQYLIPEPLSGRPKASLPVTTGNSGPTSIH
ncbi:hypothetical protein B0G71_0074 [Paraburkholderia sp. BL27I4N3]|uniref:hypothetical protein n=1 Tax=Paraburkholderia sp. BL27I4N3 TaxID=1938805 RepID=UPI000E25ECD9|nr:hypothetical protein [Paraburkholderia sp. BL27I4N3]REE17136.1 hypothetical protein B0G71_0074 [Paraburkholderia sp. BL27I4N3]